MNKTKKKQEKQVKCRVCNEDSVRQRCCWSLPRPEVSVFCQLSVLRVVVQRELDNSRNRYCCIRINEK